ncbi:hypothetical protein Dip518_001588 [Parelusimicrobium proximum]|uniref:hypothetical protein n=1 Tax=Parelusimicrobium proximum TaxID=3228953 RepID=UPI003D1702DD
MAENKKDSFTFSDKLKNSKPASASSNRVSPKVGADGKPKKTLFERTKRDAPFFIAALVALLLLPFLVKYTGGGSGGDIDQIVRPMDVIDEPVPLGAEGLDAPLAPRSGIDTLMSALRKDDGVKNEEPNLGPMPGPIDYDYPNPIEAARKDAPKAVGGPIRQPTARAATEIKRLAAGNVAGARGGMNMRYGGSGAATASKRSPGAPARPSDRVAMLPLVSGGGVGRTITGESAAAEAQRSLDALSKGPAWAALMDAQLRPTEVGSGRGGLGSDRGSRGGGAGRNQSKASLMKGMLPWWWDLMKTRDQALWQAKFDLLWKNLAKVTESFVVPLAACLLTGSDDFDPQYILGKDASDGKGAKCGDMSEEQFKKAYPNHTFSERGCYAALGLKEGEKKVGTKSAWQEGTPASGEMNFFEARWACLGGHVRTGAAIDTLVCKVNSQGSVHSSNPLDPKQGPGYFQGLDVQGGSQYANANGDGELKNEDFGVTENRMVRTRQNRVTPIEFTTEVRGRAQRWTWHHYQYVVVKNITIGTQALCFDDIDTSKNISAGMMSPLSEEDQKKSEEAVQKAKASLDAANAALASATDNADKAVKKRAADAAKKAYEAAEKDASSMKVDRVANTRATQQVTDELRNMRASGIGVPENCVVYITEGDPVTKFDYGPFAIFMQNLLHKEFPQQCDPSSKSFNCLSLVHVQYLKAVATYNHTLTGNGKLPITAIGENTFMTKYIKQKANSDRMDTNYSGKQRQKDKRMPKIAESLPCMADFPLPASDKKPETIKTIDDEEKGGGDPAKTTTGGKSKVVQVTEVYIDGDMVLGSAPLPDADVVNLTRVYAKSGGKGGITSLSELPKKSCCLRADNTVKVMIDGKEFTAAFSDSENMKSTCGVDTKSELQKCDEIIEEEIPLTGLGDCPLCTTGKVGAAMKKKLDMRALHADCLVCYETTKKHFPDEAHETLANYVSALCKEYPTEIPAEAVCEYYITTSSHASPQNHVLGFLSYISPDYIANENVGLAAKGYTEHYVGKPPADSYYLSAFKDVKDLYVGGKIQCKALAGKNIKISRANFEKYLKATCQYGFAARAGVKINDYSVYETMLALKSDTAFMNALTADQRNVVSNMTTSRLKNSEALAKINSNPDYKVIFDKYSKEIEGNRQVNCFTDEINGVMYCPGNYIPRANGGLTPLLG